MTSRNDLKKRNWTVPHAYRGSRFPFFRVLRFAFYYFFSFLLCTTAPNFGVIGGRGVLGVVLDFEVIGKDADVTVLFSRQQQDGLKHLVL